MIMTRITTAIIMYFILVFEALTGILAGIEFGIILLLFIFC